MSVWRIKFTPLCSLNLLHSISSPTWTFFILLTTLLCDNKLKWKTIKKCLKIRLFTFHPENTNFFISILFIHLDTILVSFEICYSYLYHVTHFRIVSFLMVFDDKMKFFMFFELENNTIVLVDFFFGEWKIRGKKFHQDFYYSMFYVWNHLRLWVRRYGLLNYCKI